ncbi:methyltransferase domain-containing protein [Mesorhizobium kowhaii]|uniref:methyltransferase domain-containing protein n=1 Tax=Mesorhizobium kowhaii TaxID=1300272 RepID=UPI001FDEE52E|nr:methyltransferase domain-containing protein [Mesorhizobium kowhaii]
MPFLEARALFKRGAKKVIGTDISEEVVDSARLNAKSNGASGVIFTKCTEENLFSGFEIKEKFDIIIANLPFTNGRVVGKMLDPDLKNPV